ncbi:MAG: DegT/DnrJ/EryC1/StrS family aminotransferase [Betaproteobacteria bacterium]|nr:DegT/DnrJ/EryC1/StrS family aminotransferase [Betaproteobacteria bacterium]
MTGPRLIRLSKSCIGDAEKRAVMAVLDREHLGMGAAVQQFEEALGAYFGRPAVCVVNGTAALQLALQAAGIGEEDEVLVPSLTYVASFQAISATGAIPVACDIDAGSCTLNPSDLGQRMSVRTKAIMPVHYAGGVGRLDEIYAFAGRHGLRVIEDAAHAFGTVHQGSPVGAKGDIACFSFDGIKNITSGEGGCIVTSDQEVLRRVRDARLLGVENDTLARFSGARSWDFDVTAQGWRYHMSNLMAAIGHAQLSRRAELAGRRQQLAAAYVRRLSNSPRIRPILSDFGAVVPHIFPVRIDGLADRNGLRSRMKDQGVETGVHYRPNHTLSLYARHARAPLPVTESVYPELLTLPLHPDLADDDIGHVVSILGQALS